MGMKKIIIIDDETSFTYFVKLNLEATGKYEVAVENKGELGLERVLEFNPDLILLDIIMPDVEGSTVAAQLKADIRTQDIPIIFLTATIRKEEVPRDGKIGGRFFISKPVSTEMLINRIEKAIAVQQ